MALSAYNKVLKQLRGWTYAPLAAVFHIDLHDIRGLNFCAGPNRADQVIARVGQLIGSWVGAEGISSHLWSNEFVAIKPVDHAQSVIEEALQLRRLLLSQGQSVNVAGWDLAVSIGVSCVGSSSDWPTYLRQTAQACEQAKKRGRNQIAPHSAIHDERMRQTLEADEVEDFHRLLHSGGLTLYPQPIIDIGDGRSNLVKAEFLLRIRQDDRYVPPPEGMIRALERCGRVIDLDCFAADFILAWLDEHRDEMSQLRSVSINLSASSVGDGNFMHKLFNDVRSARLPPGTLAFEITETAAIEHIEVASDTIKEFRAIGCPFSLDDFGSGLCSFAYLRSLPVEEVKIDGRFVREIASDPLSRQIISAIHQIAHTAGKKTTAEFVDNGTTLRMLREIGVDYAQGHLFYPAIPSERLLELLHPVHS